MSFLHSESFSTIRSIREKPNILDCLKVHQQDAHDDYLSDQYHQAHLRHVHAN